MALLKKEDLRSGQWTPEEEKYGEELIKAFHDGCLDCKEGRFIDSRIHAFNSAPICSLSDSPSTFAFWF